jgi:excisionase family DNA binding protein
MNPTTWTTYREYLDRGCDPAAAASLTLADALQTTLDSRRIPAAEPPPAPSADDSLSVLDVAKRLGIHRSLAYELCNEGAIDAFRVGRAIRVRPADLAAYIERHRTSVR